MEKISPEKAVELLKEKGVDVSLEQAEMVLEFMRKMAGIVVEAHLKKESLSNCKEKEKKSL